MSSPLLSILIPTHKRPATLQRCLDCLDAQTVRDTLDVIAVSDGPDTLTAKLFQQPRWSLPIRYLEIPKSQQGVCRNRAAALATAPLTLLIGDDIFLAPNACEVHLKAHGKLRTAKGEVRTVIAPSQFDLRSSHFPAAVLGFTTWDPAVGITPVMRWLERTGWQFRYPKLAQYAHGFVPETIQHRFTYTSHLSLPTEVCKRHPFREDLTAYGWEDVEWGLRLMGAGVRLYYEPDAKALHHHRMTLEDSLKRMETIGRSVQHFGRELPDRIPHGAKLWAYRVCSLLPTLRGRHCRAFLKGMGEAVATR